MKLCITARGKELEAKTDSRFGRAPYFLIIDTTTNDVEVLENAAVKDVQGAGINAAQILLTKGVEGVLTGTVGPNALRVLQSGGVKIFEGISTEDTVKEALERFKNDEYSDTSVTSDAPPAGQGAGGGGRGIGGGGRGMGGGGGRGMGGGGGRGMGDGGGGRGR